MPPVLITDGTRAKAADFQNLARIGFGAVAADWDPGADFASIFLDEATGELSVRKSGGTTVSLESGGGSSAPTIEDITGTKDGSNTAFTISSSTGTLLVYLNGQKLTEGVGYSRSGTAITAIGSKIPESGDLYEAVIFPATVIVEDISGTKDGSNTAFTISTEGSAVEVFLDGARLREGTGYTRSGVNITAIGSKIPESGAEYEAVIYP